MTERSLLWGFQGFSFRPLYQHFALFLQGFHLQQDIEAILWSFQISLSPVVHHHGQGGAAVFQEFHLLNFQIEVSPGEHPFPCYIRHHMLHAFARLQAGFAAAKGPHHQFHMKSVADRRQLHDGPGISLNFLQGFRAAADSGMDCHQGGDFRHGFH
ncbi:MAG: hypothetical protein A4E66_00707 [Syntrophus sp. PtaB.Bin001]|nr:MAG: hypothetical protein A4E66_00707 [Syntrophus sp. PtaB.Bin001]